MAPQLNPALDPRLRRLVHAQADSARLDDLTASQVVVRDGGLRRSADPTTRVLVRAGGSPPTDAAPNAVWTTVAEGIYAVELPIAELEALADDPQVQFVEAARLMAPQLITSVPETGADQLHSPAPPRPALTGAGAIVGIVDIGLDFTLDDFTNSDGTTRIAFLWDQSLNPRPGSRHRPASPEAWSTTPTRSTRR